jgi:hypothetical protein
MIFGVRRGDQLPDDIEVLKRLILEQQAAIESHQLEIERLKLILARLRRALWPQPRSPGPTDRAAGTHAGGAGSCPSSQHALFFFGQTNSENSRSERIISCMSTAEGTWSHARASLRGTCAAQHADSPRIWSSARKSTCVERQLPSYKALLVPNNCHSAPKTAYASRSVSAALQEEEESQNKGIV